MARPVRTNVPGGVHVVGVVESGTAVTRAALGHGADPAHVLAASGWAARSAHSATVREDGALELTYVVTRLDGIPPAAPQVPRDADVAPDEVGEAYQRVAAYAVVTSERGVLLTQFNSRTAIPGRWGLPGGGLDEGEDPVDGVHREVWEETGQRIELGASRDDPVAALGGAGAGGWRRGLPCRAHRLRRDLPRRRGSRSSTTSAARPRTPAGSPVPRWRGCR